MSEPVILVYSHSEYDFLWPCMIDLLEQYAKDIKIYWLTELNDIDCKLAVCPKRYIQLQYNQQDIWTTRIASALVEIEEDYVLFLHEDWLPIANIDKSILKSMTTFMKQQNCGYLLSYSHISTTSKQPGIFTGYSNYYYYKEKDHIFQPAIWNRDVFLCYCTTLKKTKHQNEDIESRQFMSNYNCWSVQNRETVTSLRTTNSLMFPHMHALSEGLWNFRKYPTLKALLESYGVNTTTRGVHTWWELDTQ